MNQTERKGRDGRQGTEVHHEGERRLLTCELSRALLLPAASLTNLQGIRAEGRQRVGRRRPDCKRQGNPRSEASVCASGRCLVSVCTVLGKHHSRTDVSSVNTKHLL